MILDFGFWVFVLSGVEECDFFSRKDAETQRNLRVRMPVEAYDSRVEEVEAYDFLNADYYDRYDFL